MRYKGLSRGSIRWLKGSIYLDYYDIRGERQTYVFARPTTTSPAERKNLEKAAIKRLDELLRERKDDVAAARSGKVLFDITKYPTFKQMCLFYWEKFESLKPYMVNDYNCHDSEWYKLEIGMNYFSDKKANEITAEDCKAFRSHLKITGKSAKRPWGNAYINRIYGKCSQVYKHCINVEGWIYNQAPKEERERYGDISSVVKVKNPFKALSKLEESPKRHYIPTLDEIKSVLARMIDDHRDMAVLAIHTGYRARNVRLLKWSEVDLIKRETWPESIKTGGGLPTCMHEDVYKMLLQRHRESGPEKSDFVFHKSDGTPFKDIHRAWNAAFDSANVPRISMEVLRTVCASWAFDRGASVGQVQRFLNHSNSQTTTRFYNQSRESTREIVEAQPSVYQFG